jgi:hypothetical protein
MAKGNEIGVFRYQTAGIEACGGVTFVAIWTRLLLRGLHVRGRQ